MCEEFVGNFDGRFGLNTNSDHFRSYPFAFSGRKNTGFCKKMYGVLPNMQRVNYWLFARASEVIRLLLLVVNAEMCTRLKPRMCVTVPLTGWWHIACKQTLALI